MTLSRVFVWFEGKKTRMNAFDICVLMSSQHISNFKFVNELRIIASH